MSEKSNQWKSTFPSEPEKVHRTVLHTLDQLDEKTAERKPFPYEKSFQYKKSLLVAASLAAVLGITAGAAEIFRWDERAIENFGNPTQELQDKMTLGGAASRQESSDTSEGITVTAMQTVQDERKIYILLKVTSEEHVLSGGCFNSLRLLTEEGENILSRAGRLGYQQTEGGSDKELYLELEAAWDAETDWSFENLTVWLDTYKPNGMAGVPSDSDIAGHWEIPVAVNTAGAEALTRVFEPGQELAIYETPLAVKRIVLTPLTVEILFQRVEDEEKIEQAKKESYIPENQLGVLRLYGTEDAEGNVTKNLWGGEDTAAEHYGGGSLIRSDEGDWTYDAEFQHIVDVEHVKAILLGDHGEIRIELQ